MNPTAKISLFSLTMLMVGAVDGVGNLPSIALFGQPLVFFFLLGSLLFLIPTALVSAELCRQLPQHSGVYAWAKMAFGKKWATLVIWLQWINTLIWFPTCLTTLVGTAAYLINPALSHSPSFLVISSVTCFWIMTLLNVKGIKRSSTLAAVGTTMGMIIPMALIIALSAVWFTLHKPLAIHLNASSILPPLNHTHTWTSLTAVITAFLGMELATVHVNKVHNAQRIFPKALCYAVLIIVLTMGIGSLGVALVIPSSHIVLVSGTLQAFQYLFNGLHLAWLSPVMGVMLVFGSLGTMVNWLISPAKGLAQAAGDNRLLKMLAVENKHGAPTRILLTQGLIVTLVTFTFFLLPSVNGSYWYLLDLSTELYVCMYLMMFLCALKLGRQLQPCQVLPGSKYSLHLISIIGIIGTLIALIVGFLPPAHIAVGSTAHYVLLFALGITAAGLPGWLLSLFVNSKQHP